MINRLNMTIIIVVHIVVQIFISRTWKYFCFVNDGTVDQLLWWEFDDDNDYNEECEEEDTKDYNEECEEEDDKDYNEDDYNNNDG